MSDLQCVLHLVDVTDVCVLFVHQIYRRGSERIMDPSWESLKKEVTVAVESEVNKAPPPPDEPTLF